MGVLTETSSSLLLLLIQMSRECHFLKKLVPILKTLRFTALLELQVRKQPRFKLVIYGSGLAKGGVCANHVASIPIWFPTSTRCGAQGDCDMWHHSMQCPLIMQNLLIDAKLLSLLASPSRTGKTHAELGKTFQSIRCQQCWARGTPGLRCCNTASYSVLKLQLLYLNCRIHNPSG